MKTTWPILALTVGCTIATADEVPIFDGLGHHHHAITTTSERTQEYFDQGFRLTYGFNHEEAIRSFEEAIRHDSTCAMCYWGIALASGPNINAAMDSAGGARAWRAVSEAVRLAPAASEKDQAFIAALADRYDHNPHAPRPQLDSAYATAMRSVAAQFPDNDDAQVLYADALMNLSPWDYWEDDGTARADTDTFLEALTRVIKRNDQHAGACHLYIHAVEKAHPERAVPCAERLPTLMPSAGHIVHMPAHIFIRVGRYAEAIELNRHAAHADERYIHAESPRGLYPLAYYPHNYDFLAFAAAMAGQREVALDAARNGAAGVDREMTTVPELGGLHNYLALELRMMVRFGMWDEIMTSAAPEDELDFVQGFWHYARGLALLRAGETSGARSELAALQRRIASPTIEPYYVWWNPARDVLKLGGYALDAEIRASEGDIDGALALMHEAVRLEDSFVYDEPPPWSVPSRQVLGRMLLDAGNPAAAARAFEQDLAVAPENGWSLFGLAAAHDALGNDADARSARNRFETAWADADARPATGSH